MFLDHQHINDTLEWIRTKSQGYTVPMWAMGEKLGSDAKHIPAKIAFYRWMLNNSLIDRYFRSLEKAAKFADRDISIFFTDYDEKKSKEIISTELRKLAVPEYVVRAVMIQIDNTKK